MKDIFTNIQGHFLLECLDKQNNITDKYEEHNLIMDKARVNVCDLVTGLSSGLKINKFVLGTMGHKTSPSVDLTVPKDSSMGFVSTRTQLFSEESANFTYPITFTATDSIDALATNIIEANAGSTIHITKTGSTVTYVIIIPITSANNTGTVAYTEAALYAGGNIFSMKTFPVKAKDDTVSLRITWSISF